MRFKVNRLKRYERNSREIAKLGLKFELLPIK